MAALGAPSSASVIAGGGKVALPATGADTFYSGALVWLDVSNNTGQVQVASIAVGDVIIGICAKTTVTTAAADLVEIYTEGIFLLDYGTPAGTDAGLALISDATATVSDNPADAVAAGIAAIAVNDALIGQIIGVTGAFGMIRLDCGKVWNATTTTSGWQYGG